jgi:hypothetical protein
MLTAPHPPIYQVLSILVALFVVLAVILLSMPKDPPTK